MTSSNYVSNFTKTGHPPSAQVARGGGRGGKSCGICAPGVSLDDVCAKNHCLSSQYGNDSISSINCRFSSNRP